MLIKYIVETFHLGEAEKKRKLVLHQTNYAIDKLNILLSDLNRLRWTIARLCEDFPEKTELANIIEDIRFLSDDSLRRIARCKVCYEERNYEEGDRLFKPAKGQMQLAEQRYEELMTVLKAIEHGSGTASADRHMR